VFDILLDFPYCQKQTDVLNKEYAMPGQSRAIFFDIGNVLASPVISSDHTTLVGLSVYPFVPEVLDAVSKQQAQLGIISNTAPSDTTETMKAVLEQAGLLRFFDAKLLLFSSVEGIDKTRVELFQRAATRSGLPPQNCVFVGEDDKERNVARRALFKVSFHPLHVFQVLKEMS
jgi:FMN phosphatase YigB (HAD superfamily)